MKLILTGVFLTTALFGISAAQDSTPNGATAPQAQNPIPSQAAPSSSGQPTTNTNIKIAPGSVIPVQLTKSIDVKKAKTGDEVDAQVTADLKAENGDIIVPKNTKVVGRVTEAQARNKEQKESQVGIAFDHAVMNGSNMTMPMSIQAIVAQSYLSGGNSSGSSRSNEGTAQPSPSPAAGGTSQGNYGSRSGGMGAPQAATPQTPQAPSADAPAPAANAHQPITGKTEGVLGIPNLTLSTTDTAHGSVMSSEKNNVKLEGGTLLLLHVNQ
jgi:hypothetical protein